MLALLSNYIQDSHQIISYKTRDEILMTKMLDRSFKVTATPENWYFLDEVVKWGFHFTNKDDFDEMVAHLSDKCCIVTMLSKLVDENESKALEKAAENLKTPSTATKSNADLMSRVAKIGQAMLPMTNKNAADEIDSSVEDIQSEPKVNPAVSVKKIMRMNLLKLDSKMDRMIDNIERLQFNQSFGSDKEDEMIKMEEKVLELRKENRHLKLQMANIEQEKSEDANVNEDLIELQKVNKEKDVEIAALKGKINDLEAALKREADSKIKEIQKIERKVNEDQRKRSQNQSNTEGNNEVVLGIMNQMYVKLFESIEGKEPMASAKPKPHRIKTIFFISILYSF